MRKLINNRITNLLGLLLVAFVLTATPSLAGPAGIDNPPPALATAPNAQPLQNVPPASARAACTTWTQVNLDAFGLGQGTDNGYSGGIYRGYISEEGFEVTVFNNQLYLGMEGDNIFGARLWRTKAGVITAQSQFDWEEVISDANGYPFGLPNPTQADHIDSIEPFNGYLYASIANRTGSPQGVKIFRSASGSPGTWSDTLSSQISSEGNTISAQTNENLKDMQVFQNHICGGSGNMTTGTQIWCSSDGQAWEQKNTSGFGSPDNYITWSGMVYSDTLLFGVQNANGTPSDSTDDIAYLFTTSDMNGTPTWTPVFTGTAGSGRVDLLGELAGYLYISHKSPNGVVILRSPSAQAGTWAQVNDLGMTAGHSVNVVPIVDGAVVFENALYVAVTNQIDGVEIWKTEAAAPDGRDWVEVGTNGMGNAYNIIAELITFNGSLYAWTSNYLTGQQVLRLDCAASPISTSKIITVSDSGCTSLADAITAANQGSTLNGCSGSSGSDQIKLTKSISIANALPAVTSTILLDGSGYTLSQTTGSGSFSLFSTAPTGYLQITHLAVQGFSGPNGPVLVNSGRAELSRSVFYNNSSTGSGGAVYSTGVLQINQSTFSGNQAGSGGAIYSTGSLNIFASTVVNNSASVSGGGILSQPVAPAVTNIKTSILAQNSASFGPDCSGSLYSQNYNLLQHLTGCTISGASSQNITDRDPELAPLNRNNHTTFNLPSHLPLPGSPLIDVAPKEICPNLDFRYQTNSVDYPQVGLANSCDLGPLELQNPETAQAVVNSNTINFANTLVVITDNAAPTAPHPGETLIRRFGIPPGGIPASAEELPFQVQISPSVNAGLDINLTICYSPWELSAANASPDSRPPQIIARSISPTTQAPSAPLIDSASLQLYRLNPSTKLWDQMGFDLRSDGCLTKNHVSQLSTWAIAAKQPTHLTLLEFRTALTASLAELLQNLRFSGWPILLLCAFAALIVIYRWLRKKSPSA